MRFYKQETDYSCSAASVRMVLEHFGEKLKESEIRKGIKTSKKGTYNDETYEYLKNRFNGKREVSIVDINVNFEDYRKWLQCISDNNIVLLSIHYKYKVFKKGRKRKCDHMMVVYKGMVYDSAKAMSVPLEAYSINGVDEIEVKEMILVAGEESC